MRKLTAASKLVFSTAIVLTLCGVAETLAEEIDLGDDSDFSGEILQINTGVAWKTFENVGFALQYNYFNVDVGINDPDWVGALKYQYRGPVLAVSGYF